MPEHGITPGIPWENANDVTQPPSLGRGISTFADDVTRQPTGISPDQSGPSIPHAQAAGVNKNNNTIGSGYTGNAS